MEIILTKQQIRQAVAEAYDECRNINEGHNADYIPYLANIDPSLFGLSVVLLDGTIISVGDCDYEFGIESVSKVFTAILALKQYGQEAVINKLCANATGMPFNSVFTILLENEQPSTPLVNAGAISACSMIRPIGDEQGKWDAIISNINELSGAPCHVIDELYKSESDTNFNNRAIAWLLKNYNRIHDDVTMSLDLYTRQCSVATTSNRLAICAATIANQGINPVTHHAVFPAEISPKITTMIASVGFYETTGDWMFTSGLPAKSGVGGGVMGVLPGVFGIAAFAPPLDHAGNSLRGQTALRSVMKKLGLGIFNGNNIRIQ